MADPVDELYTLPPSEFTAARNALAKALRAEKRRDEAEAVKALKRPSVPAWGLNQVARSSPEAIEQVLQAGAAVAAAQRRALSGVRDAGLREASQRRREAIDAVFRLAAEILRGAGAAPQTHRMAIAGTLEAASVDPEAAARVTAGRLTNELPAPSGFGDVAGFSLVPEAGRTAEKPAHEEPLHEEPLHEEPAHEAPAGDEPGDAQAAARAAAAEAAQTAALSAAQAGRRADELADRAADARRQAVRTEAEAQRIQQRAAQVRARADEAAAAADDLGAQAAAAAQKAAAAQAAAQEAAASADRT